MTRLELLRYEHGLTRAQVSEQTGIPVRTLRALETGQVAKPAAPTAKALADLYSVPVEQILGMEQAA